MVHPISAKEALCAGLLCLGVAVGANAQPGGSASGSAGTSKSAATPGGTGSAGTSAAARAGTTGASGAGGSSSAMTGAERTFAHKAAIGGMAEVELGNLAQQKASNDQVKQFGARMVQDHGRANEELKQLASTKGLQLPTSLDSKHQKDMNRLQKMSGAQFDKAYMSHMVDDHKKDVSDFQKEANSGHDSDLKAFAAKTLPVLQEHLQLAQSTNDAVKKEKSSDGASKKAGE